jgi:hypothetical protein
MMPTTAVDSSSICAPHGDHPIPMPRNQPIIRLYPFEQDRAHGEDAMAKDGRDEGSDLRRSCQKRYFSNWLEILPDATSPIFGLALMNADLSLASYHHRRPAS